MSTAPSISLFHLNEFIRRVIALNFQESIWTSCEIASFRESRGHAYLELIEKPDNQSDVIAQASGVIWRTQLNAIAKKLGSEKDAILQPGREILIKVKVEFNEKYGLKLVIEDIDPSFTVGKLALKRQAIVAALRASGLMYKNAQTKLASVIQRIAVISSPNAAGWIDFRQQLSENAYGYMLKATLFQSAMQGVNVQPEVCSRLDEIDSYPKNSFDCVVIIRGGGGKIDLADFDDEILATRIANMSLPVLTGIGHDIDESIADMVSYRALKTPTAVAEFILLHNAGFEGDIIQMGRRITENIRMKLQLENDKLNELQQRIQWQTSNLLSQQSSSMDQIKSQIHFTISNVIKTNNERLSFAEKQIILSAPENILRKGFSWTESNGIRISADNLPEDDSELVTHLSAAKVFSKVTKTQIL